MNPSVVFTEDFCTCVVFHSVTLLYWWIWLVEGGATRQKCWYVHVGKDAPGLHMDIADVAPLSQQKLLYWVVNEVKTQ